MRCMSADEGLYVVCYYKVALRYAWHSRWQSQARYASRQIISAGVAGTPSPLCNQAHASNETCTVQAGDI
nr:hypothetical protein CFP56_67616 [Quercus suber]